MLLPQTLTLCKSRDSELCCPPLCLQSPVLCLVIDSYAGSLVGGSLIKVNFKVMTKDMVSREKKTKREVIMKIFWGDRKGDIQKGATITSPHKGQGKGERKVGRERWTSILCSPCFPAGLLLLFQHWVRWLTMTLWVFQSVNSLRSHSEIVHHVAHVETPWVNSSLQSILNSISR